MQDELDKVKAKGNTQGSCSTCNKCASLKT